MKVYDKKGELFTISAKSIFEMVDNLGVGAHTPIYIYKISSELNEIRYHVDSGNGDGLFEISMVENDDEFDLKNHDWVYVSGPIYKYTSLSTTFGGLPYLPIDKAFNKLNQIK